MAGEEVRAADRVGTGEDSRSPDSISVKHNQELVHTPITKTHTHTHIDTHRHTVRTDNTHTDTHNQQDCTPTINFFQI